MPSLHNICSICNQSYDPDDMLIHHRQYHSVDGSRRFREMKFTQYSVPRSYDPQEYSRKHLNSISVRLDFGVGERERQINADQRDIHTFENFDAERKQEKLEEILKSHGIGVPNEGKTMKADVMSIPGAGSSQRTYSITSDYQSDNDDIFSMEDFQGDGKDESEGVPDPHPEKRLDCENNTSDATTSAASTDTWATAQSEDKPGSANDENAAVPIPASAKKVECESSRSCATENVAAFVKLPLEEDFEIESIASFTTAQDTLTDSFGTAKTQSEIVSISSDSNQDFFEGNEMEDRQGCFAKHFYLRGLLENPVRVIFTESPPAYVACCLCTMLSLKMVKDSCKSNHYICMECYENGRGLFCPGGLGITKANIITEVPVMGILKWLTVFCIHNDEGCQFHCRLENLKDHLNKCLYHIYHCKLCKTDVSLHYKGAHLKRCMEIYELCEACNTGIPNDEFQAHQRKCFDIIVKCPSCQARYKRKDKKSHSISCPEAFQFIKLVKENLPQGLEERKERKELNEKTIHEVQELKSTVQDIQDMPHGSGEAKEREELNQKTIHEVQELKSQVQYIQDMLHGLEGSKKCQELNQRTMHEVQELKSTVQDIQNGVKTTDKNIAVLTVRLGELLDVMMKKS